MKSPPPLFHLSITVLVTLIALPSCSIVSGAAPGVTTQSGVPKLDLIREEQRFALKYNLQNTQGVFSIFRADSPEQLRWLSQPILTAPIPALRKDGTLLGIELAERKGFFVTREYPEVRLEDLEEPGPAEQEPEPSVLGYIASQGVPDTLVSGQQFSCSFLLVGSTGLPLAIDGRARMVLLDATDKAATFPYFINPALLTFTNGMVHTSLTVSSTQRLSGCTLALAADGSPSGMSVASQNIPLVGKSAFSPQLAISEVLGKIPIQITPQKCKPDLDWTDPRLAEAWENIRRSAGTAVPVWSYPLLGGRRPVSGNFGEWYRKGGRIHAGLDFADVAGTKVIAAERGLVTSVQPAGKDSYIVIDHGYGSWTLYQHVYASGPQCKVQQGCSVIKGQEITETLDYGPPGEAGDHLHFGIRRARNVGENHIQFGGQPGRAVNPARDMNFGGQNLSDALNADMGSHVVS